MKRQPLITPQALSRLLQEAAEAWARQDYPKTLDLLGQASRRDPGNLRILLDLGRAQGLRYDFAAAESSFDRAAKLVSQPAEVFVAAARCCLEFGHDEMAANYFERATRSSKAPLSALLSVAELYERQNKLAEAAEFVARASAGFKDDPRVWLAQARLKKMSGATAEAEPLIRAALTSPNAEEPLVIQAWYELAAVLDKLGRYDEAFAALLEGKRVQQRQAGMFASQLHAVQLRVRELEKTITGDVLARWRATADLQPDRRFALLCGHPRSGTTLLEQMLDAHPDILAAEETQVFHDEAYLPLSRGFPQSATMLQVLDTASPELLQRGREDYFRYTELYLRKTIGSKLLVDKNPALTVLIPGVARLFPGAKFLVALRDPRDVCVSCFMQPLGLNPVSSAYLTMEGMVEQYTSVMGFWLKMKPRVAEQGLEVRYEDLIADPSGVCRAALEFLGVPWDESVLRHDTHARTKHLRSPSYADVVKPVYKSAAGRWRNYEKHLEPHIEKLNPLLKALGYG